MKPDSTNPDSLPRIIIVDGGFEGRSIMDNPSLVEKIMWKLKAVSEWRMSLFEQSRSDCVMLAVGFSPRDNFIMKRNVSLAPIKS